MFTTENSQNTDLYNIQNVEAEQSILGSLLLDARCIEHIESINPEDFSKEAHAIIFKALKDLVKKNIPIDLITIVDELREMEYLEDVGGISYLTSLSTIVPTTSNIKYYIDIVKELSNKRKLIKSSYELIDNIRQGKDIDSSLVGFEKSTKFEDKKSGELDSIAQVLSNLFDEMQKSPEVKIKTGISVIDKFTNGFAKHELITIGAGSGVGKSALSLKIVLNAHRQGKKVLIFSREMSKEQIAKRILLSRTGISKFNYENRNFLPSDWEKVVETIGTFSDNQIILDDKSNTIQKFKHRMRKEKPDLVVVDYVQLVTPNSTKESRERQVAEISRELQQMSKEFDAAIIQLSQLAEKNNSNYRPTGESYTRESRAIYHDSHIVIYAHRVIETKELEEAYKKTVFNERGSFDDMVATIESQKSKGVRFVEISVDKNRDGEQGREYYWFKGSDLDYYPIV